MDNFTFEVECKDREYEKLFDQHCELEEKYGYEAGVHTQMVTDNAAERDQRNALIAELQETSFAATKANGEA